MKTTFLHGDLEEEVYKQQPNRFEVKEKENVMCKLKKSLYVGVCTNRSRPEFGPEPDRNGPNRTGPGDSGPVSGP